MHNRFGLTLLTATLAASCYMPLRGQVRDENKVPLEPGETLVFKPLPRVPNHPQKVQPAKAATVAQSAASTPTRGAEQPYIVPTQPAPVLPPVYVQPKPTPIVVPAPVESHLSDLEVQASIYKVLSLPPLFTTASFQAPLGLTVELCDATVFLETPRPFDVTYTLSKDGLMNVPTTVTFMAGWGHLKIPIGYEGCVISVVASRPVIAYIGRVADVVMNHTIMVRRVIGSSGSGRRIQGILRPNVRENLLPYDIPGIQSHIDTREPWAKFLALAKVTPA